MLFVSIVKYSASFLQLILKFLKYSERVLKVYDQTEYLNSPWQSQDSVYFPEV